ncbi:hypothetical protein A1Q2_05232 [Trichosporon asahii var. asahii CBS 8904]|uniref:Uncharacterized protein n=1 Tax=Trichosporon asahii var. asahii (strain CBS 8904) TaxID=1220162 RepID=K1VMG9_TRIAC|nr:hypothetical protein A1Q2_05232 [Trichosporon asahii var. asahii CBS 8904]
MSNVIAPVRQWSRDRILKVRSRVHRTLDVQQEQVNSDIEALKRKIICDIHGHGFSALTAWDDYLSSRKHWSGSELRDLEHSTDDLQRGWVMFVSILDDAEAKQAAAAKPVELSEDLTDEPESLPSSSQSSPSDELSSYPVPSLPSRYVRSPQSSGEQGMFQSAQSTSRNDKHSKGRHSTSSARSPSPPVQGENEDDRVVACLLARNTRSWMPRTPRRRSSRESDYSY